MYDGGQFCSNYYSFGANVVAPIYGEVVKVVNHINDNTPGNTNESEPYGNYVMMKHGDHEYSVLAHLKRIRLLYMKGFNICARSDWPVWQFRKLYRTSFTLSSYECP